MPGDVGNRLGRIESKVTPGQKLMMGRHPPPFLESKKIRFQILCVSNGNTFFSEKLPKQRSLQFTRFCWKFLKTESFGEKTISDKFDFFCQNEASLGTFQTSIRFGEGCRLLTIEQSF